MGAARSSVGWRNGEMGPRTIQVNLGVWLNFRGQIDFFLEIKTSQSSLGVFGEEFGRP
jgi:hypothetical protein